MLHPLWPNAPHKAELAHGADYIRQGLARGPMTPREDAYLETMAVYFNVNGAAGPARGVASSNRKLVVLDDDPTGTQPEHNVVVVTQWDVATADLRGGILCAHEFTQPHNVSRT